MTVALDANVLIYSVDPGSPHHQAANQALVDLFESGESTYVFPPVIVAFLRVTTHPGLHGSPFSRDEAFARLRSLFAELQVQFGSADETFLDRLELVVQTVGATGNLVHDAEIVALMRTHGVDRIVTADRDFLRFEGITVTLLER